jgi:hypothetical protein
MLVYVIECAGTWAVARLRLLHHSTACAKLSDTEPARHMVPVPSLPYSDGMCLRVMTQKGVAAAATALSCFVSASLHKAIY